MSRHIDWVVDLEAPPEESTSLAERAIAHLLAKGIIIRSAEAGGEYAPLFRPGPNAERYSVQVCRDLSECGLILATERAVFHSGDSGVDSLACPRCGAVHDERQLPWSDAVESWYEGADGALTCPRCAQRSPIAEWRFMEMEWGFGHLGIGFQDWSIDSRMADEIAAALTHRVRVVHQHL